MTELEIGMAIFCMIACLIYPFALIRNLMVYVYREKCALESMEKYERLPSYDEMFNKFWVWNFDKFLKDDK